LAWFCRSIDATVGSGVPFVLLTKAITAAVPISVAMRMMKDISLSVNG
jgi:hypothetical protein